MIKYCYILGFSMTYLFGGLSILSDSSKIPRNTPPKNQTEEASSLSTLTAPPCNINFTQQPEDVLICPGVFAQFRAMAISNTSLNINYQWQLSPNANSPFTDIIIFTDNYDGSTTNQLSIEDVTGLVGYRYRLCAFTDDDCDRVYSEIVVLRDFISQQPQDMEVCVGDVANFSVFSSAENVSFQWECATGTGSSFTPISDNAIYQGTQTANLMVNSTAGLDGFSYRVVLSSDDCQVVSEPALLTVNPPIMIEDASINMCSNIEMMIDLQEFVLGTPPDLVLQYEVIEIDTNLTGVPLGTTGIGNPTHTWVNNGSDIATVTYLISVVNPPTNCEDFSFELTLQISPELLTTVDIGGSSNLCPDENRLLISMVLNGEAPFIHTWSIISSSGTAMATLDGSGSTTNPTPIFTGIGMGTVKVRYVAVDSQGCSSEPIILTFYLGEPVILESINGNFTPCEGSLETYTVLASENAYQWEVSTGGQIIGASDNPAVNILWNGAAGTVATLGVTAGSGCTIMETTQVFIQERPEVTVETTDITCFGENDGTATIFIDGIINPPNSTYEWNNSFTTATGSGLSAGDYIVTVTSENNCIEILNFDIIEPPLLTTLVLTAHITCEGGADGAATVFPIGGTPPYQYLWSTGSTEMLILNLVEGSYQVTVTDANGCQQIDEAIIHSNEPLITNLTVENAACEQDPLGSASVNVQGGTIPYNYQWLDSNGQLLSGNSSVSGLSSGNYTLIVTDDVGCNVMESFIVETQDIEPPILTCFASEAYIANLNEMGQITISVADVLEEVSDNCGVQTIIFEGDSTTVVFDCEDLQEAQTLTLIAEDSNGNTSTCSRLVLVQDLILPTIDCGNDQPLVVYLDSNSQANITAADIVLTADNCGVSWVRFSDNTLTQDYDCSDVGLFTETITVTDASGNAASCMLDISVRDEEMPMIDCGDNTVFINLDEQSSVTLNVEDLVTVSDNCEILSLTFQNGASTIIFDCDSFQPNSQVIVTAQDVSHNATTCIIEVEISPEAGLPEFACPNLPHLLPLEEDGNRILFASDLIQVQDDNCLIRNVVFSDGLTERPYDCSHVGQDISVTVIVQGYGTETETCTRTLNVSDPLNVCGD